MNQTLHDPSNHFSGVLCLPDMSDTCRFRYCLVECVHHLQASQVNWWKICLHEWIVPLTGRRWGCSALNVCQWNSIVQHKDWQKNFLTTWKVCKGLTSTDKHCVHLHVLLPIFPAVEDWSNGLWFRAKCLCNCKLNFIKICFYSYRNSLTFFSRATKVKHFRIKSELNSLLHSCSTESKDDALVWRCPVNINTCCHDYICPLTINLLSHVRDAYVGQSDGAPLWSTWHHDILYIGWNPYYWALTFMSPRCEIPQTSHPRAIMRLTDFGSNWNVLATIR